LKAALEILPAYMDGQNYILVFEISNEGFSYAIKDEENAYISLAVFHFDKAAGPGDYSILENEIHRQAPLSQNFQKIYIMYSFGESVLVPFSLYNSRENTEVLNLIHGDLHGNISVLEDVLDESSMYNIYRVPTAVLDLVNLKFPGAVKMHQYSVLLRQGAAHEDQLSIIFYPKKMVMLLNKNRTTQLINTFSYGTTDDVLYILMNTCKQYQLENIPVEISGMLEVNSPLSREIHRYFSPVTFMQLPAGCTYSEEITKHPSHYFSYIFAAGSCG
jgi:hypothetical protein